MVIEQVRNYLMLPLAGDIVTDIFSCAKGQSNYVHGETFVSSLHMGCKTVLASKRTWHMPMILVSSSSSSSSSSPSFNQD